MQMKKVSKKEENRVSPGQAVKIAQLHLNRSMFFDRCKDTCITQLFPLYNPKGSEISHFEVKVSQQDNPDGGYIIVSASEEDSPIPEFSTQGKTYTERLRRLTSREITKVIWHGPTVAEAVDSSGKTVAYIGPELVKFFDGEKPEKKGSMKPLKKKAIPLPVKKRVTSKLRQWKKLKQLLKRGRIKGHNPNGGIPTNYIEHHWRRVTGWRRVPLLHQIPANTPPNNNNFKSGCGPTAWSGLMTYHDMNWDPDLLYGNHWSNTSYIERLMMVFNRESGTSNLSGLGFTWPENMVKGFDVIKDYLLHGQGIDIAWYIFSYSPWAGGEVPEMLKFAYDMMYLNDCPTVVGYKTGTFTGHYALGIGVSLNKFYEWAPPPTSEELDQVDWSVRWGYVQVIPKSTFQPTWIDIKAVFALYCLHTGYFGWNCPRKRTLGFSSQFSMDITSIRGEIFTVWRDNVGKININRTSAENYPLPQKGNPPVALDFSNRIRLDEFNSAGAVSTCTWNYYQDQPMVSITPYIFLAWRDNEDYIHIAFTNVLALEKRSFGHVKLPERFKTSIDPAITIAQKRQTGPMLYIAYAGKPPYSSRQGHLLIIELNTFFKIARDNIDRFPRDYCNDVQKVEEIGPMGSITRITNFTKAWFPFTPSTTLHVNLDSMGTYVALVWADYYSMWHPTLGELNLYISYAFDGSWGNCRVARDPDMEHVASFDISTLTYDRPAVLYTNGYVYLAWNHSENKRIIICRRTRLPKTVNIMSGYLLETSSSGPALHYITDTGFGTVTNRNMVLGWFGTDPNKSMNHRVVYCGIGLISDDDDLPK